MRCFALAQAIRAKNATPVFIMGQNTEFISELINDAGMFCVLIDADHDVGQTVGIAKGFHAEYIVVDSYKLGLDYCAKLMGHELKVVAIDDNADPMFREDIWKARKRPFRVRPQIKRVFVRVDDSFSDTVDSALDELGLQRVDPGGADIITNMQSSDIAISAGGITAWELALLGVPSLLVTDSPEQTVNCMKLNKAGAAVSLGWIREIPVERIVGNINRLKNSRVRSQMTAAAYRKVRGNGTDYYLKQLGLLGG